MRYVKNLFVTGVTGILMLASVGSAAALSKAGAGNCAGYPNGRCESNPNQGQLVKNPGVFNLANSTQCKGDPTVNVPAYGYKNLKVNNTIINVGLDGYVSVTGNGNCIYGSNYTYISVTGNNNYVAAKGSAVYLKGTGNFFQTQGGNYVNCGGSQANVDPMTDAYDQCVTN